MAMNAMTARGLKALLKHENLESHIKDERINGVVQGGNGFVRNLSNGKIIYVNGASANGLAGIWKIMYRTATSLKDYQGGPNRWAETEQELKSGIYDLLEMTELPGGWVRSDSQLTFA
jgi:hypothetical protein